MHAHSKENPIFIGGPQNENYVRGPEMIDVQSFKEIQVSIILFMYPAYIRKKIQFLPGGKMPLGFFPGAEKLDFRAVPYSAMNMFSIQVSPQRYSSLCGFLYIMRCMC